MGKIAIPKNLVLTTIAWAGGIAVAHAQTATGLPETEQNKMVTTAVFLIAIYFIPSWIAWSRKHPNKAQIILVNIFLGWSIIGWIVALIWSVGSTKKETVVIVPGPATPNAAVAAPIASAAAPVATKTISDRIAELKAMLDSGAISQAEYDLLKADALKSIS